MDLKSIGVKVLGTLLSVLITITAYFVWDLHAWKASLDAKMAEAKYVSSSDLEVHTVRQDAVNDRVLLLFRVEDAEAK